MEEKILNILKETFELETVDKTCSQATCPAWDSMGHLSILSNVEEAFDISFEPEEMMELEDVNDIVKAVEEKLA